MSIIVQMSKIVRYFGRSLFHYHDSEKVFGQRLLHEHDSARKRSESLSYA